MSRLQQKCFVASTGMHLLLVAIIFIGPAFMAEDDSLEIREINFIPTLLVAENVAGGGNINGGARAVVPPPAPPPPVPQPPPPEPKPEVKPEPKPEPARVEEPKTAPPDPNDFAERKAKKPRIVTTPITRRPTSTKKKASSSEEQNQRQQLEQSRRAMAQELARAAAGIRQGSASATAVDDDFGPGGGGPAYAGYDSFVQMVYQNAWVKPNDTATDAPVVYVTVTIARDGTVVPGSARITSRSGDSQMDSSVQRTLDRVRTIGRPFPDAMKEKQRTYRIRFDLTKRSLT